jgi:hypothetical protein
MWYLTKIPKILHVYWGGGKLAYLRYLTIESFIRYNPEWEVRFYYPSISNADKGHSWVTTEQRYNVTWDDYTPNLNKLNIETISIDFSNIGKNMSEVHRSDYLRWQLLSTNGGLWADMDILFFRPMDYLAVNIPENSDKETVVCISDYGHSVGFMMGSANNNTYKTMSEESLKQYSSDGYQCMGSIMFNKLFPTIESIPSGVNIGMEAVYSYNATQTGSIFGNGLSPKNNPNSIGTHWYAGGVPAGVFLNATNGGKNPNNSLIGKLIKEYED